MKRYTIKTKHATYEDCTIKIGRYVASPGRQKGFGRKHIAILDSDGDPIMTATANLHHIPLDILMKDWPEDDNYVFIKNYSENEGIVDELVRHGIIELTGQETELGYGIKVPYVKILIED